MTAITIAQLTAKGSEHGEQVALFAWAAIARVFGFKSAFDWADGTPLGKIERGPAVPELEWLHAIPNGGSRGDDEKARAIRGGQMKAEGARSGVPDVFLPVPRVQGYEPPRNQPVYWHGLYIEMKKPSLRPKSADAKGGLSDDQIRFRDYAHEHDYGWMVCYSWRDAATAIEQYLTHGDR